MNRILIKAHHPVGPSVGEIYTVTDSRTLEHFFQTLKIKVGTNLKVIFANYGTGFVIVEKFDSQSVTLLVTRHDPLMQKGPFHLAVAFSRPPTMRKILEHGVGFGISEFHVFQSELGEKSYAQSQLWHTQEYEKLIQLGVEQSGHYTQIPQVFRYENSHGFKKDFFADDSGLVTPPTFLLSPHTQKTFLDYPEMVSSEMGPIRLLIGPERGFTKAEEEYFIHEKKCLPVCISKGLLRVEMATFASLAQLEMLMLKKKSA